MPDVDVEALERDLRATVDGEIRFSPGDRALYAKDASNYRATPLGVVIPRSVEALADAVRVCGRHKAPITNRGGGTALAGQTTNRAVIIDASKYVNKTVSIDPEKKIAVVEPGIVLDELQKACAPHGLRFGPDPSTHSRCTIGGMVGNNSCGVHSLAWGRTVDNVAALDIITSDGVEMTVACHDDAEYARIVQAGGRQGEIYHAIRQIALDHQELIREKYPDIPRRVSGYNLNQLLPENGFHVARALVGSESTCVTILRAHLHLRPDPKETVLVVAGFEDVCHAADAVPGIVAHGPIGCEGMDDRLAGFMRLKHLHEHTLDLFPKGCGWLLIPFGGDTREDARAQADRLTDWLKDQPRYTGCTVYEEPEKKAVVWTARESGLGATAFVPGATRDTWPGWEDAAVAPENLGAYLREFLTLLEDYGYYASLYGHFGEGLIHTRIDFGLENAEEIARFRRFMEDAARLAVKHGGSLSGEHGDGQARGELLPLMFGDALVRAMEAFKHAWDPDDIMNPGKVVKARPLDADLRMGPRFPRPADANLGLWFQYPHSDRSFVRETLRCVGVGKCRQHEGGTMCPSYRGTMEEMHSTRGRAHLLQEMLIGQAIPDGWNDETVFEALDLCLGCKACKKECPVDVDMATYKAEFMAHYFQSHRRPRQAWSMGRIHDWARLVGRVPGAAVLANLSTQTPGLSTIAKKVAGIHDKRSVPAFARPDFQTWFRRHGERGQDSGPRVVLFTDSFNTYFETEPLKAAAEVLAAAGCRVEIPARHVCCGRPLYDFGFLDRARALMRSNLDALKDALDDGAYVVGVEPSCMAAFRDELPNLFPDDDQAKRLCDRSYMLGEFLTTVVKWTPPKADGALRLHGHCTHKAIFGIEGDVDCLKATGADVENTDLGCCGMAGSFGFEHDKYEVSLRIAEQQFLPAVRECQTDGGPTFVATGFSCREQVRQLTGRRPPSPAEVLRDALRSGS